MQRSLLPPLMTTFDQCDTTLPCGQRDVSTVAPQALALLNNEFVHQRAEALATCLAKPDGDELQQVQAIWRAILKRDAEPEEATAALAHVATQQKRFEGEHSRQLAWASLCVVLFNSNEYLYVD